MNNDAYSFLLNNNSVIDKFQMVSLPSECFLSLFCLLLLVQGNSVHRQEEQAYTFTC